VKAGAGLDGPLGRQGDVYRFDCIAIVDNKLEAFGGRLPSWMAVRVVSVYIRASTQRGSPPYVEVNHGRTATGQVFRSLAHGGPSQVSDLAITRDRETCDGSSVSEGAEDLAGCCSAMVDLDISGEPRWVEARIYTETTLTAIQDGRRPPNALTCCQQSQYSQSGRRLPGARSGPSRPAPLSQSPAAWRR